MPNRMTALDASFLFMENASTPMHAGGVAVFTPPPGGFDHERLVRLIKQRIPFVPRYRQRIRDVPFGVARPVWVDDERFDVTYHVRRSALPQAGLARAAERAGRAPHEPPARPQPAAVGDVPRRGPGRRQLRHRQQEPSGARRRPLRRRHRAGHARPDGGDRRRRRATAGGPAASRPTSSCCRRRSPSSTTRPAAAVEAVRDTVTDVSKTAARFGASAAGHGLRGAGRRPALGGQPAQRAHRRAAPIRDRRPVPGRPQEGAGCARRHGQRHRSWPWSRAPCAPGSMARGIGGGAGRRACKAMLPISVAVSSAASGHAGRQPRVGDARRAAGRRGRSCGPAAADQLPARAARGGQPVRRRRLDRQHRRASHRRRSTPSAPASGRRCRAASTTSSSRTCRARSVRCTRPARGWWRPTRACRSPRNQALSIGLISYDGGVYFGLYADRDALPDLDLLVTCLQRVDGRAAGSHRAVRPHPAGGASAPPPHRRRRPGARHDRRRGAQAAARARPRRRRRARRHLGGRRAGRHGAGVRLRGGRRRHHRRHVGGLRPGRPHRRRGGHRRAAAALRRRGGHVRAPRRLRLRPDPRDRRPAPGATEAARPRLAAPHRHRACATCGQLPATTVLSAFMPEGTRSLERVGHLVDAVTPFGEWSPHRGVWVVAMDYEDGRRVVFGRPGAPVAPLSSAVMASCAIPGWFAPVPINGRTFVDGGAVSATSIDVVAHAGLDEVYVVAPMMSFAMDQPVGRHGPPRAALASRGHQGRPAGGRAWCAPPERTCAWSVRDRRTSSRSGRTSWTTPACGSCWRPRCARARNAWRESESFPATG